MYLKMIFCLLLLLLNFSQLHAVIIKVPSNVSTIQEALFAANADDTVLVESGIYYENIIWPYKNGIKLIGLEGSENTIIDGDHKRSVININPINVAIDSTTVIKGITIRNGGNVNAGGGIYINNASPYIMQCVITDNESNTLGGGIYCDDSNAIFNNVRVLNNKSQHGGGCYFTNSVVYLSTCDIERNQAEASGGLRSSNSSLVTQHVRVRYNIASRYGGGISSNGGDISNVIIYNNEAEDGGGLFLTNSVNVKNVILANNSVSNKGGGLHARVANLNMQDVTFINNKSQGQGGAFYEYHTAFNLKRITFFNNIALEEGDAILSNSSSHLENAFSNCNFEDNGSAIFDEHQEMETPNLWWGHFSGPYHQSQNPNGLGDSVSYGVSILPWLTSPDIYAPPIPLKNLELTGSGSDYVSLKWDESNLPDIQIYRIFICSDSSNINLTSIDSIDVEPKVITTTFNNLPEGQEYYITGIVVDTNDNRSWYSSIVSATTRKIDIQYVQMENTEDLSHVISHHPEISWNYNDSAERAQTQYELHVSSFQDFGVIDMWNSGM